MNLTEVSVFDNVYQLETTDPVLGGPGGIANRQAQNLANRTKFLLDAINALDGSGGPFNLDASGGALPTAGSGPAGAIKRKDLYVVTVAGTISSIPLQQGDELIARIDNAVSITDYIVLQGNAVLATPTVLGLVKLAQNLSLGSAADATLSLAGLISLFAKLASPAFTGNPTTPDQTAGNNSASIANTRYVDAAISQEASDRNAAISTEATALGNADTALQNNINTEATTRSNADNTEASTRSAADIVLQTNINLKADKSDANAWNNLALSGGISAGSNVPQYRINQFGALEFRGNCSFSVTLGSASNTALVILQGTLAAAIDAAINANSFYVSKSVNISCGVNFGPFLAYPCPAQLSLNAVAHQMVLTIGEFNGSGFPAGTYSGTLSFEGISLQIN